MGMAQQAELVALLKKNSVPGIQLIYTNGAAVKAFNLGLRKSGTTQRVAANSIFQAASLGKVVLAYTTLRLHDQGLIDLDKPLLGPAQLGRKPFKSQLENLGPELEICARQLLELFRRRLRIPPKNTGKNCRQVL